LKHPTTGPDLRRLRENSGIARVIVAKMARTSEVTVFKFERGDKLKCDTRSRLLSAYAAISRDADAVRNHGGRVDMAWSRQQVDRFIRENAVHVVYARAGDPSTRRYVLTEDQLTALCRLHLLAAGKDV